MDFLKENKDSSLLGKRKNREPKNKKKNSSKNKEESKCGDGNSALKPVYTFKNGLRFVETYNYEYATFAKKRWIGQQLFDVYAKEFKAFSKKYYEDAIVDGR